MIPIAIPLRRLLWGISFLLLPFAFTLGPTSAMGLSKGSGALAPVLSQLADPAVRALPPAQQAEILGVAQRGPGSLLHEGDRVLVNVRLEPSAVDGPETTPAIGTDPLSSDEAQQTATVAVDPAVLDQLGTMPGVASVTPSRAPISYGSGSTSLAADQCAGGSVVSEGLVQLKVDQARQASGLTGAGITVGVLSDSFDTATAAADGSGPIATHAASDILSGDLPGPGGSCGTQQTGVDVLEDSTGGEPTDEGRAMLQTVHDLAPDASLAFATAFRSEESFAQNIERLAAPVPTGAGAKVIVDDVGYFEEPFFQDGPVAVAIAKVTSEGVTYLTAAGNNNLFEGENEIASWEAPSFRDSAGCPVAVQILSGFKGTHCMDFDPGARTDQTFGITVAAGATLTVDLQWAEPWNGVGTDLDAFLLDSGGELLTGSADENTGPEGTQRPLEIVQWENRATSSRTVQLAINRYSGATSPRLKFALLENGSGVTKTEYPSSAAGQIVGPTIFGHAGAPDAITVAAVSYANATEPERFSSRGPVTHYFGPVVGTGAAAALAAPEAIAKPDVAATDCGATTFFASRYGGSTWRFCGTSAAAPHAAAVAALLLQRDPTASVATIRASLTGTATPVGAFPATAVGSGSIDAYAAIASLPGTPIAGTAVIPPPVVEPQASPVTPDLGPPITIPGARRPPETFIKRHPPQLVRTRGAAVRLRFAFAADQTGSEFLCTVDHGRSHRCGAKLSCRLAVGAHVLRVRARGADGLVDQSPAVFRFRVKRVG